MNQHVKSIIHSPMELKFQEMRLEILRINCLISVDNVSK